LVCCGVYDTFGEEPSDILDNDCKDSNGEAEFEYEFGFEFIFLGAKSGISNVIDVGRFNGLGSDNNAPSSDVLGNAVAIWRLDPDLGVGEYSTGGGGMF
jgi:hypothetical protein